MMSMAVGIGVFAVGWLFGLVTGWALSQADQANSRRCNRAGVGKHVPARDRNCWDPRERGRDEK